MQPGLRPLPVELGPPRPGRADHRRVQGADRRVRAHADLLREHRRGRADHPCRLLGAGGLCHGPSRRGEVLDQRLAHHRPRSPPGWRPATTWTSRSRWTGPRRRSTTPSGAPAPSPPPSPPWTAWPRPGSPASSSPWWSPGTTSGQLDAFKALADRFGAQLRLTRLRPSGRGADVWDELHPTADQQRELYDWLRRPRRGRPDRGLVLPPRRLRRRPPGTQPLRGRTGGLPGRPGGRRLRLPLRHPRRVPGRQRPVPRWVHLGVAAAPTSSPSSARPRAPAPARRAATSTPAGADAWRPSSSPACPLDGPDPECVLGHGEYALGARGDGETPRPSPDHSSPPRRVPVALTPSHRPDRRCDESPLAGAGTALRAE